MNARGDRQGDFLAMRGTIGLLVGIVIVAIGLAGLGASLAQMMTHADPHGLLISLGGLGTFLLAGLVMLLLLPR
jgi:hypothetical protein